MRPNFIANLRTFSGQATASFVHDSSSPPTAIKLRVENDLGPTNVTLDQKYQGVYQTNTKLGTVTVTQGTSFSVYPWGTSLARNYVPYFESATRTYGWIGWGPRPDPYPDEQQGEVVVETSIANSALLFDG